MRHFELRISVTHSTWSSAHTFAVTSTIGFLFDYIQARELDTDHIVNFREQLESALYTYLSTRHIQIVRLEIYEKGASPSDEPIEVLDLKFDVEDSDALSASERQRLEDEDQNVSRKDVMKQVQEMNDLSASTDSTVYRILLGLYSENDIGQSVPQVDELITTIHRTDVPDAVVRDSEDDAHPSGATENSLVWYEVIPRSDQ